MIDAVETRQTRKRKNKSKRKVKIFKEKSVMFLNNSLTFSENCSTLVYSEHETKQSP